MIKSFYLFCTSLVLAACGGAPDYNNTNNTNQAPQANNVVAANIPWQSGVFVNHNEFVNRCEVPRTGINPSTNQPYRDLQGSGLEERHWLRSWSNDFYLWYDEILDRNPSSFADTQQYFNLLKTEERTNSGTPKDQFHFSSPTQSTDDFFNSGITMSLGISWSFVNSSPPRSIRVRYVEPNSPAFSAGIRRGDTLIQVDGVDVINGNSQDAVDTINTGINPPDNNPTHQYRFQRTDSSTFDTTLTATTFTTSPVLFSDTLSTATGQVGYIVFNDHISTAEQQLIDTITRFSGQGVSDLVLDMRYNGGGFLSIANRLSYMIAGSGRTNGKIFENLVFNDKHQERDPFSGRRLEPQSFLTNGSNGSALPSLNLSKVFVITTRATCSASESVINALRGVDVEVIQIGERTCGKPYGFYGTDNCGTTYFSINFTGENHKGFGSYSDGFVPSAADNGEDFIRGCNSTDDLDNLLGSTSESMLSAALFFRDNDQCPSGTLSSDITEQRQARKTVNQSAAINAAIENYRNAKIIER